MAGFYKFLAPDDYVEKQEESRMTKVDFYLSPNEGAAARETVACKLVDKAFGLKHNIYIHTENHDHAMRLDNLLWTFRPGSFIPHSLYQPDAEQESPVTIGHHDNPQISCSVLVNLASEVPLFFSRFDRVAEIVDANAQSRAQARERFKFYKDRGYELKTHDLGR